MAKKPGTFRHIDVNKKIPISSKPMSRQNVFLIVVFLVAALVPLLYFGWINFYDSFLERDAPIVRVTNPPIGLGEDVVSINIVMSDKGGSGVGELKILSEQYGKVKELVRTKIKGNDAYHSINVEISAKAHQLIEGDAKLYVSSADRSIFKNTSTLAFPVVVDYTAPKLSALSDDVSLSQGGTGVVFYKVKDRSDTYSGVKVGSKMFPGFPAKNLSEAFAEYEDVYFSFFSVPHDYNFSTEEVKLFAQDAAGNIGTADFKHQVKEVSLSKQKVSLSEDYLRGKVNSLFSRFIKLDTSRDALLAGGAIKSDRDMVSRFRAVNERYRDLVERSIALLFEDPQAVKYWKQPFLAPVSGKAQYEFGVVLSYSLRDLDAGSYSHFGIDYASRSGTPVQAVNDGVVTLAEELGVYGNTVIVDHGFGLFSIYAHLSSVSVVKGVPVKQADVIGKIGDSGLTPNNKLHYELRLHGVPVRPSDWSNQRWIADNIETKIQQLAIILEAEKNLKDQGSSSGGATEDIQSQKVGSTTSPIEEKITDDTIAPSKNNENLDLDYDHLIQDEDIKELLKD
jgi:hypothetical protein